MYYFGHYINVLLTRGSRLNSGLKEITGCHLFMALIEQGTCQQPIGPLKRT